MTSSAPTEISRLRSVSAPSRRSVSAPAPSPSRRGSATTEISPAPPFSVEAFLRPVAEETETERSKPRRISATPLVLLLSSVSLIYVLLYLLAFLLGRG